MLLLLLGLAECLSGGSGTVDAGGGGGGGGGVGSDRSDGEVDANIVDTVVVDSGVDEANWCGSSGDCAKDNGVDPVLSPPLSTSDT